MPNHIHLIFRHLTQKVEIENPITDIMRNFKRYTSRKCNELLNRTGTFWQSERYDRIISDQEELENTIRYTLHNPVKAASRIIGKNGLILIVIQNFLRRLYKYSQ